MLLVKPIIHYPRVAQVGKTYLMTIDLQPSDDFAWQQGEEDYPVYCRVSSDSFIVKSASEPVILIHRFGGSYGGVNLLLEALFEQSECSISISLSNRWGASIRDISLSSAVVLPADNVEEKPLAFLKNKKKIHSKNSFLNHSIRIEETAVGSTIVSGDGNTVHVIQQILEQRQEETTRVITPVGPNPYKGLSAFQVSDADRYFGREAQVERLWRRFQDLYGQSDFPRFLSILGASGCGKSSLARAGFIPELARRLLHGKESMRVAVLVPGSRPLEALAGVLAKAATEDPLPVKKTEEFERILQKSTEAGEYEGLQRIADLIPSIRDTPLVVLVDQFEEVYFFCKDLEQRQAFIGNLLHAASDLTGHVSVVITLRSDFLGETQRHQALNQVIGSDWSINVPAMTEAELRHAIAEPAKRAGHPLDEATIDLLVKDTEGREGALPLLQFALTRIWEGLNDGKTPAATYRYIDGVGGALAGKAQDLYNKLSSSEQAIARQVFVGLVQLGEGTRDTRRRTTINNLVSNQDSPERVRMVINRFASPGARLISLGSQGGRETVELTHEALIYHWRLLREWMDSSREEIRFLRRLEETAIYWEQQGRSDGLLWRSPDFDHLEEYYQRRGNSFNSLCVDFYEAARKVNRRPRWWPFQ